MNLYRTNGDLIGTGDSLRKIAEQHKTNLRGADLSGAILPDEWRQMNISGLAGLLNTANTGESDEHQANLS